LEEPKGWFPNSKYSETSPFLLLLSARKKIFRLGGEQKTQNSVLPIEGVNSTIQHKTIDKGKIIMYILVNSKVNIQSQYPRSRTLSRSEKNRAGISELKSGSASLFVGAPGRAHLLEGENPLQA